MERLTEYEVVGGHVHAVPTGDVDQTMMRLAAYEDTGLEPEQCENAKIIIESAFSDDTSKAERIRELLTADRDGRLVVPPCKVGDRLYEVTGRKTISVYKVKAIRVELFGLFIEWDIVEGFVWQSLSGINAEEIGKTVFLNREEAEKALEELKMTAQREVKSDLDCADCLCRVCARNTVNDSVNPTVAYKECSCDECRVGSIVVETIEDCDKFAPDCDMLLKSCNLYSLLIVI